MAGIRLEGATSTNVAEVDVTNNLKVNLPTTATQAGFVQVAEVIPGASLANGLHITEEGTAIVGQHLQLLDLSWNSSSTAWANRIGTVASTMTKAVSNGFMRLNSGASVSLPAGISIYSNRVITIEEAREIKFRGYLRTTNAAAINKIAEFGLGYYAFAAGQSAAMNEFIGFRFTTGGQLLAVLETSTGGVPTSQTVVLNGGIPFSDGVTREYEMTITESKVIFFVAGSWVATITRDPTLWGTLKGISLPFIARIANTASVSGACQFDIGAISITRQGPENRDLSLVSALQGKHSVYGQADLIAAATSPHNMPASGTAPTAAVGSNTASVLNNTANMGGYYRNTLTGVVLAAHTNILVAAYQNPSVPTTAGSGNNARNFICTGLTISPMVVTTALTGGGFTAGWFVGVGATATSYATADADGTTAVAQKAPRTLPLSLVSTLAAAAAVGVVSTDVGDHTFQFSTPLVVHPGEFLHVGFRTIAVTAAVTAGAADGSIGVLGYWE